MNMFVPLPVFIQLRWRHIDQDGLFFHTYLLLKQLAEFAFKGKSADAVHIDILQRE